MKISELLPRLSLNATIARSLNQGLHDAAPADLEEIHKQEIEIQTHTLLDMLQDPSTTTIQMEDQLTLLSNTIDYEQSNGYHQNGNQHNLNLLILTGAMCVVSNEPRFNHASIIRTVTEVAADIYGSTPHGNPVKYACYNLMMATDLNNYNEGHRRAYLLANASGIVKTALEQFQDLAEQSTTPNGHK